MRPDLAVTIAAMISAVAFGVARAMNPNASVLAIAFISFAGLFLVLFYLLHSIFAGKRASANPWGAATLEWTHCTSPPDPHNFDGNQDGVACEGPG